MGWPGDKASVINGNASEYLARTPSRPIKVLGDTEGKEDLLE